MIPLARNGSSMITFAVRRRAQHGWRAEERALAEEVAGHAWAEVERARAEANLLESEARLIGRKEAFQSALDGAPLEGVTRRAGTHRR